MSSKIVPEYGIVGAGAVSASLVGQLPRNARALGPVAGVSYRVASRIANTLKAGWAVRSLDELERVRLILFYSPPEHLAALSQALEKARIEWRGKSLVFCDCEAGPALVARFRAAGASVAKLRRCGVAGRLAVCGSAPALTFANRLVRELKLKPLFVDDSAGALFEAAMTMSSAALTPLLDGVARALRQSGVRDTDANHVAAGLVGRTAAEYAHSGRQSWAWHIQEPDPRELRAQLGALEEPWQSLLRELLLLGFSNFDRHASVADLIRALGSEQPGAD